MPKKALDEIPTLHALSPPARPPRSPNDSVNWSEISSAGDSGEDFLETEEAWNIREEQILNSLNKLAHILFQLVKILKEILGDRSFEIWRHYNNASPSQNWQYWYHYCYALLFVLYTSLSILIITGEN